MIQKKMKIDGDRIARIISLVVVKIITALSDIRCLYALGCTCKEIINSIGSLNYRSIATANLKALISQFGLPLEFLSQLYSMNGHISGSIVLQCMTGDFFPESDLDIFAKTPEDVVMLTEYFT